GQATLHDLVPADQLSPFGFEMRVYALDEVALQLCFVLQSERVLQRLAFATGFPAGFVHFVASDVDIGGREKLDYFVKHMGKERIGLLIACAKLGMVMGMACATQFGIHG